MAEIVAREMLILLDRMKKEAPALPRSGRTNVSCVQNKIANNKFTFIVGEKKRKTEIFPLRRRNDHFRIKETKGKQIKFGSFNGEK